jgi:hypothetical protein
MAINWGTTRIRYPRDDRLLECVEPDRERVRAFRTWGGISPAAGRARAADSADGSRAAPRTAPPARHPTSTRRERLSRPSSQRKSACRRGRLGWNRRPDAGAIGWLHAFSLGRRNAKAHSSEARDCDAAHGVRPTGQLASFVLATIMAMLVVLGLRHAARTPAEAEILASRRPPSRTATGVAQ